MTVVEEKLPSVFFWESCIVIIELVQSVERERLKQLLHPPLREGQPLYSKTVSVI